MNNQDLEQLRTTLKELKAAWFMETHRGVDMDLAKLRSIEKEISEIEDLIEAGGEHEQ